MTRLSLSTLATLPPVVARPDYDPAALGVGIVHLGLGAFHRAHQAVFTEGVLARDPRWGICGVSMKTPRATAALAAQDGLYTVLTKGESGSSARVIGALRATVFAGHDVAALIARFADPAVSVVTLTVTEKGYSHDPASGRLDFSNVDIVHDLANPQRPVSALGLLTAGLAARRAAGAGALNVVCCDNLPRNGRVLEGLVGEFASRLDPRLAAWISIHAAFPGTMVDRIVPATTEADVAEVAQRLGVADAAPVVAEAFSQWVIEDRFAAARPAWEAAGATLVRDVEPYETMKLRLLNGSHSTLAYLGFLMGHATIAQAAGDHALAAFVERQMREEIAPTLAPPHGVRLADYAAELMRRFRNPALPHRTRQIAMDGSQKLPQRLLGTVRDRLAAGRPVTQLTLAIAGWMRYAYGRDESGARIEVSDPLAARFASAADAHRGDPAAFSGALLAIDAIFGADLPRDPRFVAPVTAWLGTLFERGAAATIDQCNAQARATPDTP